MLDCQHFGLKAAGHHLTSVVLHAANTLLLFGLLKRLTATMWRSAIVAALFAWHPLHVESVAWIAERKDVLSAFWFLLSLWFYAAYAERTGGPQRSNGRFAGIVCYGAALSSYALGLMSKPMLVTLPFVLLLLDFWPLNRFRAHDSTSAFRTLAGLCLEKGPFAALAATCCWLTVFGQNRGFAIVSTGGLPFAKRLGHTFIAYTHYVAVALVPHKLAVSYPYASDESFGQVAGAGVLLLLISVLALRAARSRPYFLAGWLWFLGMLVPVIGLVQVGDQAWADRYTYLPLIGLFICVVWGIADLAEATISRHRAMPVCGAACTILALAMIVSTGIQLQYWQSTRQLFQHAADVTPNNSRAMAVLGGFLASEGKTEQALEYYHRSLVFRPDNPETHFAIGRLLEQQGKLDEAIGEYEKALWFKPLRERTHIRIGLALARQMKYAEAAAHYQAALAFNPDSAAALTDLAKISHIQGRTEEAIEMYSHALKLDPRLAEAHNNLGVLLLQKGEVEKGVMELRSALRLKPGDVETECNLALGLNQQQLWAEAEKLFSKVLHFKPQDANLFCGAGNALKHLGRTRDAMRSYAHALLLKPDFAEALDGLSWILATDSNQEFRNGTEAVRMAELACELSANKDAGKLKTLAAAYAESGRFDEAVIATKKANELAKWAGNKEVADECRRMEERFKDSKPWRESR
jgi:tetratricopeptide (TPR) repeat protein